MALNEQLKFKKIDLAKNSLDGFKITEFPTFKIFPADDKTNTHEYTGHAILEEFANFIKKYSKHDVLVPEIIKELSLIHI